MRAWNNTHRNQNQGVNVETHDFAWAIRKLKSGEKVMREGWNGKGMFVELQTPDAHSKMTEPYLFMKTAQGGLIPWLASQADMLADDWDLVE